MSKVAIVVDSTVNLPQSYIEKYQINVLPQTLVWEGKEYRDGIDIQPGELYHRLESAKSIPTTAQVTPLQFKQAVSSQLDHGNDVLAIVVSEKLSGTLQSAIQAREFLPGNRFEIVDSRLASMAMGFVVLAAARAAEQGASLAECKAIAEQAREHTGVIFVVDTLKYLHLGGRIGGATRFLGTALNLKPMLELVDGRIEAVERVRTRRKALDRLVEVIEQRIAGRKPVRLAALHANAEVDALQLIDQAAARFEVVETVCTELSPVVGAHTGPGTVGLAFIAGL